MASKVCSQKDTFWVINISDKNVCLSDLFVTLGAGRSYDLLSKNFNYTKEQLLKSAESGSLYKKRDKIVVRNVPPVVEQKQLYTISEQPLIRLAHNDVVIEDVYYEELEFNDTSLAEENAEFAEQDHLGRFKK